MVTTALLLKRFSSRGIWCGIAFVFCLLAHGSQLQAGDELKRLEGHTDKITSMALFPDGRTLVTGSDDKSVRLWDIEAGKELRVLSRHDNFVLSVAVSPDGKQVLSAGGGEFKNGQFTTGKDLALKLWDVETGKQLFKLEGHSTPVWSVRFLADGKQAVSAASPPDGSLRVWDLVQKKQIKKIDGQYAGQGVAVSPDGKVLLAALASPQNAATLRDLKTGRETHRLRGHTAMIRGAAFTPDGKRVLTCSGNFVKGGIDTSLRLWDVETGQEIRKFTGHTQLVWCVAIAPDGRKALSGSIDGTVRLWDFETGNELHRFEGHAVIENDPRVGERADIRSVLFTPDGKYAVSAGHDRTIRVWKLPE